MKPFHWNSGITAVSVAACLGSLASARQNASPSAQAGNIDKAIAANALFGSLQS